MRGPRSFFWIGGLLAVLAGVLPAHAGPQTATILAPCIEPSTRYSDLLNTETLPNGVCAWSTTIHGGQFSIHLENTDAADLDVFFYDEHGDYLDANVGGAPGFCGSFGGNEPAAARLAVVTFSPGCISTAPAGVKFTFNG